MDNNFSCLLLNVYFPCDNYSNNIIADEYIECIDYIEQLFNMSDCNSFICCGDYNTSFSRDNAHSRFLIDFMHRNSLIKSWDHVLAKLDYTYVNHALGHKSSIDHFIMSKNIFDFLIDSSVFMDPMNPSNHNIIQLSITCLGSIVYSCSARVQSSSTPVYVRVG